MRIKFFLLLGMGIMAMGSSAYAQDIIKTKAGKDIAAKVLEISDEEVSYKMYDNKKVRGISHG